MRLPNLPKIEFSITLFYKIGMWCFFIMALGNIYSLAQWWPELDWGIRVVKLAGIAFNFLLVKFFSYMKSTSQPQTTPNITDEDMVKALDKLT